MSLYPGPQRSGMANLVQEFLLRLAFVLQDLGEWLRSNGRRLEDWACPSGHPVVPQPEPYWKLP
jgi:hypothetical protein